MQLSEYISTLQDEVRMRAFWRDVIVEFVATFFLVSIQAALPLSWDKGLGDVVQVALGMGFVVSCIAWALGDFGGAHMNPAVTIAMAIRVDITVLRALLYVIAQCLGALAGAGFVYGVTPADQREGLATTTLGEGVNEWQGLLIEAWITCLLVITIIGSTNLRRKGALYMATIPIGLAEATGIMAAYASTGASMNPARSFGPAVVMSIWDNHWVYWVGPVVGAGMAVAVYSLADMADSGSMGQRDSNTKLSQDDEYQEKYTTK